MPSASHGDVELSDSTTNSQSRALNQFLARRRIEAFKIAQSALRHEEDALDAVQDAMLQLARAYSERPAEEWKPLFYRILENRIRDMQRRRTVRGRVISWLPFRGNDEDDEEQDPIAQAPSSDPLPLRKLEIAETMGALEKAIEALPPAAAASVHAANTRGPGCGGHGHRDGLLRGQRQDTLLPRVAVAPRATWRFLDMSPPAPLGSSNEMPGEFEQRARALLEDSVQRVDGRIRSRLNQARHAAIEEASRRPSPWRRFTLMPAASAVASGGAGCVCPVPHSHPGDSLVTEAGGRAGVEDLDLLADGDALDLVSDDATDTGQFYEWAVDQADSNEASTTGA